MVTLQSVRSAKMATLAEIFQDSFQINQITSELIASAIIFSVIAIIGWLAYYAFGRYFSSWTGKTKSTIDDDIFHNIRNVTVLLIIVSGLYYTLTSLSFIQPYSDLVYRGFMIVGIILAAFTVTRISNVFADWYIKRNSKNGNGNNHILFMLKKIVQLTVYILALLAIILWVFNVQDLSGLVVGLGVGGIAIAFALQNTLSDVFSAFSIYFDRPFEIGDFIVVGNNSGTVTSIGVKSTRIKLLQGEELVLSNKELATAQVRNFRKLQKRRITFTIGVTYDTPLDKLKRIPEIIKKIIESVELAELFKVNFTEFGDYSLKFMVIYHVKVADYGSYLDTQQAINYAIKEAFEKEGINIAFPTQTIYVSKNE